MTFIERDTSGSIKQTHMSDTVKILFNMVHHRATLVMIRASLPCGSCETGMGKERMEEGEVTPGP